MIFLQPSGPMPGSMEQKNRIAGMRCFLQDPLSDGGPGCIGLYAARVGAARIAAGGTTISTRPVATS
jgi:hypothetical protein